MDSRSRERAFNEVATMIGQFTDTAKFAVNNKISSINFGIAIEVFKRASIQAMDRRKDADQARLHATNKLLEMATDLYLDMTINDIKYRSNHEGRGTVELTLAELEALFPEKPEPTRPEDVFN